MVNGLAAEAMEAPACYTHIYRNKGLPREKPKLHPSAVPL